MSGAPSGISTERHKTAIREAAIDVHLMYPDMPRLRCEHIAEQVVANYLEAISRGGQSRPFGDAVKAK